MIPYRRIIAQAASRVNALSGSTAAAREAAYVASPLTTVQIGSTDFPFSEIKDALAGVIGRIISTYANVPNHPYRTYNLSQTDNIPTGGVIPSINASGIPIVGVYGAIRDSSDGKVLTEQPVQIIETINNNADGFLKRPYYYFKIVDSRIEHTRPNVVIDVNTFSYADTITNIEADGNADLPDALFDCCWTGLVSVLFNDGEFLDMASTCGQYFNAVLNQMTTGAISFAPAPVHMSSQQSGIS